MLMTTTNPQLDNLPAWIWDVPLKFYNSSRVTEYDRSYILVSVHLSPADFFRWDQALRHDKRQVSFSLIESLGFWAHATGGFSQAAQRIYAGKVLLGATLFISNKKDTFNIIYMMSDTTVKNDCPEWFFSPMAYAGTPDNWLALNN